MPQLMADENEAPDFSNFDQFGPKLEFAVSHAVVDMAFAMGLMDLTQTRPTGDFEVLLRDFIETNLVSEENAGAFLVSKANGLFTQADLNSFVAAYPSTVIAVRGNPLSWLEGDYIPPVKFVPSTFERGAESCPGTREGGPTTIDLKGEMQHSLIAIHLSERHDYNGISTVANYPGAEASTPPTISSSGINDNYIPGITCDPEPTACPGVLPTVTAFAAVPENGGVKLTYTLANMPPEFCYWGRIWITRSGGGSGTKTFLRSANHQGIFYDFTGAPNTTYNYSIVAYIAYQDINAPIDPASGLRWVTCKTPNNILYTSAVFPTGGGALKTLAGSNTSNSNIRYDWNNNLNLPITQYRLRRATTSGFLNSATLGWATNSWFYNYPASDRGKLIEMQIQYSTGGPWQGSYYDKTYGSYRNSGEAFYYYGLRMPTVSAWELGESNLFGAPEIRLTAVQASANQSTTTLANTFLPMKACTVPLTVTIERKVFGIVVSRHTRTYNVNSGFYYPSAAPNGYKILTAWNSDLHSSAITVKTLETDFHVPVITSVTQTSSTETSLEAKFGFKLEEVVNGSIGVKSVWKNAQEVKIRYPDGDLPIGEDIIYYHEQPAVVKGQQLMGLTSFSDRCANLIFHLN